MLFFCLRLFNNSFSVFVSMLELKLFFVFPPTFVLRSNVVVVVVVVFVVVVVVAVVVVKRTNLNSKLKIEENLEFIFLTNGLKNF
jgi:hypothetical protein